jgi:hypothetical protein
MGWADLELRLGDGRRGMRMVWGTEYEDGMGRRYVGIRLAHHIT